MHFKTSIATFTGSVFLFIFGIAAAPSASAAAPLDACTLITQSQVSTAVGVAVGAGEHTTPTYVKTCTWPRPGHPASGVKYVTLNLEQANGFEAGKNLMKQMQSTMHATMSSSSGIGDDAYYLSMHANYTALMVKKGNVAFKVAVYGDVPIDKAKAMTKTVALHVLSKL